MWWTPTHAYRGRGTPGKSWFSPSTVWVPGIEHRSSRLAVSAISPTLSPFSNHKFSDRITHFMWHTWGPLLNFRVFSCHIDPYGIVLHCPKVIRTRCSEQESKALFRGPQFIVNPLFFLTFFIDKCFLNLGGGYSFLMITINHLLFLARVWF